MNEMETLYNKVNNLNQKVAENNSQRQLNMGRQEALQQQLNDALQNYKTLYNVTISLATLQSEIDSVFQTIEEKSRNIAEILGLINEGRYEEANAKAGVKAEPINIPVADGLPKTIQPETSSVPTDVAETPVNAPTPLVAPIPNVAESVPTAETTTETAPVKGKRGRKKKSETVEVAPTTEENATVENTVEEHMNAPVEEPLGTEVNINDLPAPNVNANNVPQPTIIPTLAGTPIAPVGSVPNAPSAPIAPNPTPAPLQNVAPSVTPIAPSVSPAVAPSAPTPQAVSAPFAPLPNTNAPKPVAPPTMGMPNPMPMQSAPIPTAPMPTAPSQSAPTQPSVPTPPVRPIAPLPTAPTSQSAPTPIQGLPFVNSNPSAIPSAPMPAPMPAPMSTPIPAPMSAPMPAPMPMPSATPQPVPSPFPTYKPINNNIGPITGEALE